MSTSFADFGLAPALLRAVRERGYEAPTPVQSAAIPAVLARGDVMVRAQTGSGKTAAFELPALHRLAHTPRHVPRRSYVLVLVPTRELAQQVGESMRELAASFAERLKVAVVFGGVSINPQMMGLRGGADAIVATPGRLLDLVEHNAVDLRDVAMLVLDEADRLLDEGFADELSRIVALLPQERQTLLFSATFAPAVQGLAQQLLREPTVVDVAADPTLAPQIEQRAVLVDTARRTPLLRHLVEQGGWSRVLVFVATRYATEHVAGKLSEKGIEAAALHGELSQGARQRTLDDFKAGRLKVLVATDVAARGIHITQLPVVVNYDLPRSPADHVHRIGRTGRAGAKGLAVSFVTAATEAHFRLIEKRQDQRVPREQVPGFEPTEAAPEAPSTGGVKGKRKSKKDKLREAAARGQ